MDRTRLTARGFLSLAVMGMAAACNRSPAPDEQMQRDLQQAAASTMELAPSGTGRQVVSAIEQAPHGQVAPRKVAAPKTTKAPTKVAEQSKEPIAIAPTKPQISPPPPGGYKSVNEVIRKAPFPIKP